MPPSFVHGALLDAARNSLDPDLIRSTSERRRQLLLRRSIGHAMQGLVARAVRTTGSIDAWALPFLEEALRVREAHRRHTGTLVSAAGTLEAVGIPSMVVKGASLVERYYEDDALRPYGDVDMLVPTGRFADALASLEGAGYSLLDRNWHMLRSDLRGQLHLRSPERDVLELHWHPVNSRRTRAALGVRSDDIWRSSRPAVIAGAKVRVPAREVELVHLCMHAAMHGCDRLIWLVDIHKVAAGPELDPAEVVRTARAWRFGAGTYLVLALVDRWFGLDGPVRQALDALRPGYLTLAAFDRLVDRWDLGRPGADARFRQLLFATAGDGAIRRTQLIWSLVVPPDTSDPHARAGRTRSHLRRMTVGAATRIRNKLDEHDHGEGTEFLDAGDQVIDRAAYLRDVKCLTT
jgi:hypothetical protein